jgi:hypothetical protein
MRKFTLFVLFVCLVFHLPAQVVSIADARKAAEGNTVEVEGIVLNDYSTTGNTFYIQDATAGLAVYDVNITTFKKGDLVRVKGVLVNYKGLLELTTLVSNAIISSNNPLPAAKVVTADQLTGNAAEALESMLVSVTGASFAATDQGKTFDYGTSGKNYTMTANGKTFLARISKNNPLAGQTIPAYYVTLTGCLGQYDYSGTAATRTGYQLLLRDAADIQKASSINFTTPARVGNITKSEVNIAWTTDVAGTTEAFYGKTKALELGKLGNTNTSTQHLLSISGNPAEIIYVKPFSVLGNDTAKTETVVLVTESNSSGTFQSFFNKPVDITKSTGVNAVFLNQTAETKIIEYIDKAKSSLDIAIYNFNNNGLSNNISTAINAAADKGVTVRLIYCGTSANLGTNDLSAKVNKLQGPNGNSRNGIMHNKFVIIDANATDANAPYVISGSMNWTVGNMYDDANNILIVQDQSLAKVYTLEFEEMWGSSTLLPDASKSKWGKDKTNNTPHELVIGGKRVESYFSPTDGVNGRIIELCKTANADMEIATMLLTRVQIASAIADAAQAGTKVSFVCDNKSSLVTSSDGNTVPNFIAEAAGQNFVDYTSGGVMHNKYMIIDQGNTASDPLVLTGSHNWSAAADAENDENTLVIHDATLANVYYQNFVELLKGGTVILDVPRIVENGGTNVYPNPCKEIVNINYLASKQTDVKVKILDLTGRTVFEKLFVLQEGANVLHLDLKKMSGVYFVKVEANQQVFNQKIIVNN